MLPNKLAFVDLETTGTSAAYGRIIEIGVLRVENDVITKTYHSLINPQRYLPPEVEMLTGITIHDLENKPTFREVARDILEILDDCIFVAHNVRFDYSFLKHEFLREQISFSTKHFCTVKLSRLLYPQAAHHNLDAIIQRFGFSCEQRHRAFEDASVLWEFYKTARQAHPADTFMQAVNQALRRPTVPIQLKQEDLDNLPEFPGVYIFYAANGMPLYIGKSKNIKDRVLSHFCGDIRSTREMNIAQQVASIETTVTAGELGALFLEAKLVKKMLPLYNRMLRNKRELVGLRKEINSGGYETVKMETLQTVSKFHSFKDAKENYLNSETSFDSLLGFFKSRKEAKNFLTNIATEFQLCEKLLGLEKTSAACFGYRLNKCKGACIGKDPVLFYNLRFTTAFYKTKIKPWPFAGPVIIQEDNDLTNTKEYFLIDKWCYLGSVKTIAEDNLSNLETDYSFDLDMYKILLRFLYKSENLKKIKPVKNIAQVLQSELIS